MGAFAIVGLWIQVFDAPPLTYTDSKTADWSLEFSPANVRLRCLEEDASRSQVEIYRTDAGLVKLDIGEKTFWHGTSVRAAHWPTRDGATVVTLPNHKVHADRSVVGRSSIQPNAVMASWWPWYQQTVPALKLCSATWGFWKLPKRS